MSARVAVLAAGAAAVLAFAVEPVTIAAFSGASPGAELPAPWSRVMLPRAKPAAITLVDDGGRTVLEVRAEAATGSATHRLAVDAAAASRLTWRWKVDRVVEAADLERKSGDDFAARVYVTFDVPAASLTFAERARIQIARLLYSVEVPAAALCYVWDNRYPAGTTRWNAYTSQVRMVVLQSGAARAGTWVDESRDVAADFRAAFGARYPGPVPRITGVAVSADTDQTGESVTAWFSDVKLAARP